MRLVENKDFIMVWDDILDPSNCQFVIDHFEYAKSMGLTYSRQEVEHIPTVAKKDETYFPMDENIEELQIANSKIFGNLRNTLRLVVDKYIQEHSGLTNSTFAFNTFRLQKTAIGGGYHAWHHERGDNENIYRVLAVILYLNDVEEGGETEFFHQHKRVKPKAGRLVIWPAGFTHTHRGNPPISGEKYIITTWGVFA